MEKNLGFKQDAANTCVGIRIAESLPRAEPLVELRDHLVGFPNRGIVRHSDGVRVQWNFEGCYFARADAGPKHNSVHNDQDNSYFGSPGGQRGYPLRPETRKFYNNFRRANKSN